LPLSKEKKGGPIGSKREKKDVFFCLPGEEKGKRKVFEAVVGGEGGRGGGADHTTPY